MDYFETKLTQRLVLPTGHTDHRKEEALFYASYGERTARLARFWGWLGSWIKVPQITPAPQHLRKVTE